MEHNHKKTHTHTPTDAQTHTRTHNMEDALTRATLHGKLVQDAARQGRAGVRGVERRRTLPGMGLPLNSSSRSWMKRPLEASISLGGFWKGFPDRAVRNLLRATGDTVGPMEAKPPSGSL